MVLFPQAPPQLTWHLWLVILAGKQKCWPLVSTAWGEETPVSALSEPRQTDLFNCMVLIYRGSDVSHGGNRSSPFAWDSHWPLWPGHSSTSQCIISKRTSGSPLNRHLISCKCVAFVLTNSVWRVLVFISFNEVALKIKYRA